MKLDSIIYIIYFAMLNERTNIDNMIITSYKKKLCPHVTDPSNDCYCSRLTSCDIEKAIYYCSNNFESCEIYKISSTDIRQGVVSQ